MQYAVSAADASLYDGVPGQGATPGAPGVSGESELNQAAGAQLPSSRPCTPMDTDAAAAE